MSSDADSAEISLPFEHLLRQEGDLSVFLSLMLSSIRELESDQDSPDPTGDIAILFEPSTRTVLFVRRTSLDAFPNGVVPGKQGRPPASKSAVEGMTRVEIKEEEEGSCVICLEDWSEGDVAAEMPCKHKFHSKCVEEWLGIHGTCPVCRYEMPVEDEVEKEADVLFRIAINGGERGSQTGGEGEGAESEADSEPTIQTEV